MVNDENDLMLVLFPISDGLKSKKKKIFSLYPILEILCYSGLMLFLYAHNSVFFFLISFFNIYILFFGIFFFGACKSGLLFLKTMLRVC